MNILHCRIAWSSHLILTKAAMLYLFLIFRAVCPWVRPLMRQLQMQRMDAKREWLAAAIEDGYPIKEPNDIDNYSGQFKLRLPKSLHKSLSVHAKEEGVSMNQYCMYLLSRNDALRRPRQGIS